DDDGPAKSGTTSGKLTGKALTDAITRAGGPKYRYIEREPVNNEEGGEPGGNIRCAYLVREDRFRPDDDSIHRIGEGNAVFNRTRKSLEMHGTFLPTGADIALIDNHFSSKFGAQSAFGVQQPPRDDTKKLRKGQNKVVDERMIEIAEDHPGRRAMSI